MTGPHNFLRDQLLAQGEPARENFVRYQQETQVMLEQNERRLRMEKWGMIALWLFAVAFMTVCLVLVGYLGKTPEMTLLAFAFLLLLCGGIEIVKHFINRSRVELLKELKGLELHVLSLEQRLNQPRSAGGKQE